MWIEETAFNLLIKGHVAAVDEMQRELEKRIGEIDNKDEDIKQLKHKLEKATEKLNEAKEQLRRMRK